MLSLLLTPLRNAGMFGQFGAKIRLLRLFSRVVAEAVAPTPGVLRPGLKFLTSPGQPGTMSGTLPAQPAVEPKGPRRRWTRFPRALFPIFRLGRMPAPGRAKSSSLTRVTFRVGW
jgi:hypothetical protein